MFNKKLKLQVKQIISSFDTLIKSDNIIIGELGYCKLKISELLGRSSKLESKVDKATNRIDKLEKLSNEYRDTLTRKEGDHIGSELDCKFDVEDYVECNTCGCLVNKNKVLVSASLAIKYEKYPCWGLSLNQTIKPSEMKAVTIYTCKHCEKNTIKNKKKK